MEKLSKLEDNIGYRFKNPELLRRAVTHSSYANEVRGNNECYERQEFLGDSVLGLVTAEYLFLYTPALPEGQMTRLRADLVCEQNLHKVALSLGLSGFMRLGHGELKTGGRMRVSVLADMVEAIIAAIYLDSGLEEAKRFIHNRILSGVDPGNYRNPLDNKTALQELLQVNGERSIVYELVGETGPDHDKTFGYRVLIDGTLAGEGTGKTKKEAEQAAAGKTLELLRK